MPTARRGAVEVADLVLIPCRPSAVDLAAIQTTATLVQMLRQPAYGVFTAGSPNAPRVYAEAGELVEGYGTPPCPILLPDRAASATPAPKGGACWRPNPRATRPTSSDRSTRGHVDKSACRCPGAKEKERHEP